MGAKPDSNGGGVSGGMIANGWLEPLLISDVVNVAIEPLGVVVGNEDDDEASADDVGFTMVFLKRTGTSSVKWSNCGKCECSILKGKPRVKV